MSETFWNWAENHRYSPSQVLRPRTVDEVRRAVVSCPKLKVLGSRHAFNTIADTPDAMLSTEHLNQVQDIDVPGRRATVQAGIKYGELCELLDRQGMALANMASLPHISVAGACLTATHGSGVRNQNLSAAVSAMGVVLADGSLARVSRASLGDEFDGWVVNLGALGVVTTLTLDLVPRYLIRQDIYENLPLEALQNHFDEVMSSAYSVSMFFDWHQPVINQVWMKSAVVPGRAGSAPAELFGAKPAGGNRHPIPGASAESCTPQMGQPGAWYSRLPHFRMDFVPSSGEELQTEYFVPRTHAYEAICAVYAVREQVAPLVHVSEIRTIAADQQWMSPCYEMDSVAIHFTWKKDWEQVRRLLPIVEDALDPFQCKPHWAKLFSMAPQKLRSRYPRLPDFKRLAEAKDPTGKFRNDFLDKNLFDD